MRPDPWRPTRSRARTTRADAPRTGGSRRCTATVLTRRPPLGRRISPSPRPTRPGSRARCRRRPRRMPPARSSSVRRSSSSRCTGCTVTAAWPRSSSGSRRHLRACGGASSQGLRPLRRGHRRRPHRPTEQEAPPAGEPRQGVPLLGRLRTLLRQRRPDALPLGHLRRPRGRGDEGRHRDPKVGHVQERPRPLSCSV